MRDRLCSRLTDPLSGLIERKTIRYLTPTCLDFSSYPIGSIPQRYRSFPPKVIAIKTRASSDRGTSATDTVVVSRSGMANGARIGISTPFVDSDIFSPHGPPKHADHIEKHG